MNSRVLTKVFYALFLISCLSGCKPGVPRDIIQPDEMEDILYDYHVADAMAQGKTDYAYHQTLYREAVLKKYGITSAELDSSLVYYMRHTEQMRDIYEVISDRLKDEALALGASESEVNRFSMSASGDTTDIWAGDKSLLLMPQTPYNVSQFSVVADSSFHAGDSFVLTFRCDFIYQEGMRDGLALMAVKYANDSVVTQYSRLPNSNEYTLRIYNTINEKIKEIKGYFYLGKGSDTGTPSSTLKLMSVHDIHLVRLHLASDKKKDDTVSKDTLGTTRDTISVRALSKTSDDGMKPQPVKSVESEQQSPAVKSKPGEPVPVGTNAPKEFKRLNK